MQRDPRCVTVSVKPVSGTGYRPRRGVKLDCRSSFSGAPGHLAIVMGDKNHLFDVLGKAILIDLKPDCEAGWRGVALGKSPHSA
jgi:hypothetical protein